jgi:hypothetical protein
MNNPRCLQCGRPAENIGGNLKRNCLCHPRVGFIAETDPIDVDFDNPIGADALQAFIDRRPWEYPGSKD